MTWWRCSPKRERPQAMAGTIDVVSAMTERMSDDSVAQFVAGSVVPRAARPAVSRRRSRRSCPSTIGSGSCSRWPKRRWLGFRDWPRGVVHRTVGQRRRNADVLLRRGLRLVGLRPRARQRADASRRRRADQRRSARTVAGMARHRQRRRAAQVSIISCSSICSRSKRIRCDGATWRRRSSRHADDLVRVGYFDQAWLLAEAVAERCGRAIPIVSRTRERHSSSLAAAR